LAGVEFKGAAYFGSGSPQKEDRDDLASGG
jgi:hypothetical protein